MRSRVRSGQAVECVRLAAEERPHARIGGLVAQLARIAVRDDALGLAVEQDDAVGGDEDAAEVVGDDHERDAEVVGEPADRRVERRRGDRVEAGRRLVHEQDRRVERHRARDAGALLHAAGELGRQVAGERFETDELELHPRDEVDRVVRQIGVLLERQPDVLEQRHRPEQRARLVHDAEAAQDRGAFRLVGRDDVVAVDVDVARDRLDESDHVLHDRGLAAPGAAEDAEHLAAADLEVDVLLDRHVVVAGVEILDADDDVGGAHRVRVRCRADSTRRRTARRRRRAG